MGILDQLAGGLRGAAGVLSPDVQKQTMEEDQRNQLLRQQQAQMLVTTLAKQVADGTMTPEAARAATSARGLNVPPELFGGPSASTQKAMSEVNREKEYRAAIDALGPDATQEQLTGVASKFGTADKVLDVQQKSLDRRATIAAAVTKAQTDAAAKIEAARLRGEDQKEIARIVQDGREKIAGLVASLRQPPQPQIVQTENGPMQVDRSGQATPIVGPDGKPVTPKSTEKALPVSAAQKLMENQQNLRRAEQALALISGQKVGDVQGDPNATGVKGYAPDAILQRTDPNGVPTRAAIGDLGSLVIHDRSGAAVTAAEFPRLRPFIPLVTDSPEVAKQKLSRFVTEYRKVVQEARDFYKESGYKVPDVLQPSGVNTGPNIDDLVKKYAK
jgi:hypothetical protein